MIDSLIQKINQLSPYEVYGTITAIQGLILTAEIKNKMVSIGTRCVIHPSMDDPFSPIKPIAAEVVGFKDNKVLIMPFGSLIGISPGSQVTFKQGMAMIQPSQKWCGRVINALAEPIDDMGDLDIGVDSYPVYGTPLSSSQRARVIDRIDVGIRAVNTFLTCCKGQRMGIFAGSGVGKSMLLSMFARNTDCDICVIGLIGERGREVKDFIEETLGEEGMKRSILIVATSDESPLMRRQAAHLTLCIAEYFRDQGLSVLCLMDSVTRFAMAQREIGLSAGEPPTTKGYPPSAFSELSRLLERAGPGIDRTRGKPHYNFRGEEIGTGYITGLFTVLVDGGDMDEPIADAVRGILDGHILLDRNIAERGRYPAIDILKSVSRTVPGCHSDAENALVRQARRLLSTYDDMADMIRLGAYKTGSNPDVDVAVSKHPSLNEFLSQRGSEQDFILSSFDKLNTIVNE